jgi:uncharacterized protein YigE (DUF2233 family)
VKRILTAGVVLSLVLCAVQWYRNQKVSDNLLPVPSATLPPTARPVRIKTITYNGSVYAYDTIRATPDSVTLLPNFGPRKNSQTLMTEHLCVYGVNGGFYNVDNTPLGLFISENTVFYKQSASTFFNGFFWIDTQNQTGITDTLPSRELSYALQSGPLLIQSGVPVSLRIRNDENARRSTVGIVRDTDTIFFTVVYNPESVFDGPVLSDLPSILSSISLQENVTLESAVNLDGGSASAFYSEDTKLGELTPVGSIFCIK